MKTIHSILGTLILVTSLVPAKTASAQGLAWAASFPVPANFVCQPFGNVRFTPEPDTSGELAAYQFSAADGFGGSVWIAVLTPNTFFEEPQMHVVRFLWLDSKGVQILTNDITTSKRQFIPPTPVVAEGDEFNVAITRFNKTELAIQMKSTSSEGLVETNFLRRIVRVGKTFRVTDTPLAVREVILPETRASTDKFGFFSHELHGEPQTWTNLVIRRYLNK